MGQQQRQVLIFCIEWSPYAWLLLAAAAACRCWIRTWWPLDMAIGGCWPIPTGMVMLLLWRERRKKNRIDCEVEEDPVLLFDGADTVSPRGSRRLFLLCRWFLLMSFLSTTRFARFHSLWGYGGVAFARGKAYNRQAKYVFTGQKDSISTWLTFLRASKAIFRRLCPEILIEHGWWTDMGFSEEVNSRLAESFVIIVNHGIVLLPDCRRSTLIWRFDISRWWQFLVSVAQRWWSIMANVKKRCFEAGRHSSRAEILSLLMGLSSEVWW